MARTDATHKDLPKKESMALANLTIIRAGGPERARVWFKFTCAHCGARVIFQEANKVFENGECGECGKTTLRIPRYGFLLAVETGGNTPNDSHDGVDQTNDDMPGEDHDESDIEA